MTCIDQGSATVDRPARTRHHSGRAARSCIDEAAGPDPGQQDHGADYTSEPRQYHHRELGISPVWENEPYRQQNYDYSLGSDGVVQRAAILNYVTSGSVAAQRHASRLSSNDLAHAPDPVDFAYAPFTGVSSSTTADEYSVSNQSMSLTPWSTPSIDRQHQTPVYIPRDYYTATPRPPGSASSNFAMQTFDDEYSIYPYNAISADSGSDRHPVYFRPQGFPQHTVNHTGRRRWSQAQRGVCLTGSSLSPEPSEVSLMAYNPQLHTSRPQTGRYAASGPELFPWLEQKMIHSLLTEDGRPIDVHISASVDKNVCYEEGNWTAYRRNYIQTSASFQLESRIDKDSKIYLEDENCRRRRIMAMGFRIRAAIDAPEGPDMPLVQQTPKRDKGPCTKPGIYKCWPLAHDVATTFTPTPSLKLDLPYQEVAEATEAKNDFSQASFSGSHAVFERIQFLKATQNNGLRRAAQQYYQLLTELVVDVREEGQETPRWVAVGRVASGKLVVRGRSPGHYQEKMNKQKSAINRDRDSQSVDQEPSETLRRGGKRKSPSTPSSRCDRACHTESSENIDPGRLDQVTPSLAPSYGADTFGEPTSYLPLEHISDEFCSTPSTLRVGAVKPPYADRSEIAQTPDSNAFDSIEGVVQQHELKFPSAASIAYPSPSQRFPSRASSETPIAVGYHQLDPASNFPLATHGTGSFSPKPGSGSFSQQKFIDNNGLLLKVEFPSQGNLLHMRSFPVDA